MFVLPVLGAYNFTMMHRSPPPILNVRMKGLQTTQDILQEGLAVAIA